MGFFRVLGLFVAVGACSVVTMTQDRGLTDGVYSDAQATRGSRVYRQACASCHARNLEGGEMGPGLTGGPFISPWAGESLAALMAYVQETMPQDNPGGLNEQDYSDVLAYMLKVNEFPSGDVDLTAESVEHIVIEVIESTP
jgi:mono/diheme cytochrome c family protein